MSETKTQTLHCHHGSGHDWTRDAQRGKPPLFCPEHKPAAPAPTPKNTNGTVTLHCKAGDHDWERPSVRGKRPENCPEHQPQTSAKPAKLSKEEKVQRQVEGRARATASKIVAADEHARAYLEWSKSDAQTFAAYKLAQANALEPDEIRKAYELWRAVAEAMPQLPPPGSISRVGS